VTKTTVPSPFPPDETEPTLRVPQRDVRQLITEAHPDLAASWSSVRQEPLSKAIATATEKFDPESSSLFDIGYAVDKRRYDKRIPPIHIVVAVTGKCRNIITFQTIEEDHLEFSSPTHSAMRAPSITGTEISQWSKCGAPIRQVHFARLVDEDPVFMAARLVTTTTIFRPLYHVEPVPMRFPNDAFMRSSTGPRSSRLDANPILEITVAQTGGFSHADVTFNPWYQQQFSIVDIRGYWTVWEMDQVKNGRQSVWSPKIVKSGSLPSSDPSFKRRPQLDGWATIEWIHDVGTIIVANRRNVMIYAFLDDQVPPRTVELGMVKQSEWVLGLQRNPRNLSQFFVLTTTRILWFDVGIVPGEDGVDGAEMSLYPRVSRRHFRDPNDTTLRLSDIVVYQGMYWSDRINKLNANSLSRSVPCRLLPAYSPCAIIPLSVYK
jgi:RNA polymerase I-specific transcription initiation factor RRN6